MNNKIPNGRWIHILPPTILIYIVAFMDRTNIGFAMAGGMDRELGMSAALSGLAAGIFFIGYMILQVPGGIIAEKGSAKKFISWSIIAWGSLTILTGFAQNTTQLMILRFLLGVAEGGVWPAILVIISHWFPNEERGRANAIFIMNIAIASIITGPLSGWILSIWDWRMVFIVEGLISLSLIAVWLPLISDCPEDAKWISKEEREYLVTKLWEEQDAFKEKQTGPASFKEIWTDANVWKLILIYFCYQTGVYGFALWLPTIIKQLTHTGIQSVGWLSVFPYVGTIIGLYVFGKLSDKSMNRKLYTGLPLLGFALCLLLSVQFESRIWISFAFLIGCGIFFAAPSGVFWTIPPMLFTAETAGAVRGIINALGNLGGFLGPYIVGWFTSYFSRNAGIYGLVSFLIAGFILTMFLPAVTAGTVAKKETSKGETVTQ